MSDPAVSRRCHAIHLPWNKLPKRWPRHCKRRAAIGLGKSIGPAGFLPLSFATWALPEALFAREGSIQYARTVIQFGLKSKVRRSG